MALRKGERLTARKRELPFSFYPVGRGMRRYGIFDVQFASSPWAVMRQVASSSLSGAFRDETLAFL